MCQERGAGAQSWLIVVIATIRSTFAWLPQKSERQFELGNLRVIGVIDSIFESASAFEDFTIPTCWVADLSLILKDQNLRNPHTHCVSLAQRYQHASPTRTQEDRHRSVE